MYKKSFVITVVLSFLIMSVLVGCYGKSVRHLASDVGLVTPGTTTKKEVVTYLGQPNAEYEVAEGGILWVYYEENKTLLRDTPYIGGKVGDRSYEVVKVLINDDIVQDVSYRTMGEEEFKETGLAETE